jgi:hypothetical protein
MRKNEWKRFETWIEIKVSKIGQTFATLSLKEKITWLKQTSLKKKECNCGELGVTFPALVVLLILRMRSLQASSSSSGILMVLVW